MSFLGGLFKTRPKVVPVGNSTLFAPEAKFLKDLQLILNEKKIEDRSKQKERLTYTGFKSEDNHIIDLAVGSPGYGRRFTSPPKSIGNLTYLRRFYSHSNDINSLPSTVKHLINLQELDIMASGPDTFESFPKVLKDLPNLKILRFAGIFIEYDFSPIGSLTQLEELYLGTNKLTSLPDSIGQLSKLKKLTIRDNPLSSLPQTIGNLSDLEDLSLSFVPSVANFRSLPDSLIQLKNLKRFVLAGAYLESFPESLRKSLNTILPTLEGHGCKVIIPPTENQK